MSDVVETNGEPATEAERNTLLICYILHAAAILVGLTAIVGVVINHIKINETTSDFARSHHRWMIRTFWFGLVFAVVSYALMLVLVGFVTIFLTYIWWIYRVVRGILYFTERKPIPNGGGDFF